MLREGGVARYIGRNVNARSTGGIENMRRTREPEEVEEPVSARGAAGRSQRSRSTDEAEWRYPRRGSPRRRRVALWTASVIAVLSGIVLIASVVGHFDFFTSSTEPTSVTLNMTPGPSLPVRHVQPPDLRDLNRALDTYISRM